MLKYAEELLQQGQVEEALQILNMYTNTHPQDMHGWLLLGVASHQKHNFSEALHALDVALSIEPDHLQARNIKAVVLCDIGRHQEALQIYRKSLLLVPNDVSLLLNMAIVLEQNSELSEALKCYDQILANNPDLYPALLNRGALLLSLGSKEEALDNNLHLAATHPNNANALFNLGEAYLTLDHWESALTAYTQALACKPNIAKVYFATGLSLAMLRRFKEAQQAFTAALSIDPDICNRNMRNAAALVKGELREFFPQVVYLLKETQRLHSCDWRNWKELIKEFEIQIACSREGLNMLCERSLLFPTLALPISSESRYALAQHIAAKITENVKTATYPTFSHPNINTSDVNTKKLKIGYVSPAFRNHPTATLSRRLYALHDRSKFEVYGYSLNPDVNNSSTRHDIEKGCDFFRELCGMDDITAAETIYHDKIDILIDLDGYTSLTRSEIFALRPAPLQISYLGFPHSTGASFIDYFIADEIIISASNRKYFSEKIAYLPDCYFLFDNQQAISQAILKQDNFGLPKNGIVFCCHNSNYKITPDIFDSWMSILKRVPNSILWLLKGNDSAQNNLLREAELRGIISSRLVFAEFMPNELHLARYRLADLFLDTFQCNAHTTAAEALWAGLPVLTCAGETMASRVAASLLSAIDLHEMITTTPDQYEEKAIYLATHPEELARIRTLLEHNRLTTPLFNTEQQVKNIEAVYEHIWERHKSDLTPETFFIKNAI